MKFYEVRTKFPTVRIISHTDLDGYGSAAAISAFLNRVMGYDPGDIEIIHCSPSDSYDYAPGFNIITDLSVNSSGNWREMVKHNQEPGNLIWWIDHHATSEEMISQHRELLDIPRIINTKYAATMLCWALHFETRVRAARLGIDPMDDTVEEVFKTIQEASTDDADFGGLGVFAPLAVKLTDDWDLFKHKIPGSIHFNSSFYTCPAFIRDAKTQYFQDAFGELPDRYEDTMDEDRLHRIDRATQFLIDFGSTAVDWQRYLYLTSLLMSGFTCRLEPTVETKDNPEIRKIRFICHNRTDFNMVTGAESLMKEYTWGINFNLKDRGFCHTVYCTKPGIISAKDVAYAMGGGGHPGCAGFTTRNFVLKDIAPLDDQMKILIKQDLNVIKRRIEPTPHEDVETILRKRPGEV